MGVAFVTVPNFSGFINDMYRTNQPIALIQVLHDVTSAFDHVSTIGFGVLLSEYLLPISLLSCKATWIYIHICICLIYRLCSRVITCLCVFFLIVICLGRDR